MGLKSRPHFSVNSDPGRGWCPRGWQCRKKKCKVCRRYSGFELNSMENINKVKL